MGLTFLWLTGQLEVLTYGHERLLHRALCNQPFLYTSRIGLPICHIFFEFLGYLLVSDLLIAAPFETDERFQKYATRRNYEEFSRQGLKMKHYNVRLHTRVYI